MFFYLVNIFSAKFFRVNGDIYRHRSEFPPYDIHSRIFINSNFDRLGEPITEQFAKHHNDDFPFYTRRMRKYEDVDSLDIPSTPNEKHGKKHVGRFSQFINLLFRGVKAISPSMIFIHLFMAGVFIFVGYQLRSMEEHGNFVRVPTEQLNK